MSGIRTSRTSRSARTPRARLVAVAASVVLAAFSMTACDDGTGVADEGAASTARTATPPTTGDSGGTGGEGTGGKDTGNGGTGDSGSGKPGASGASASSGSSGSSGSTGTSTSGSGGPKSDSGAPSSDKAVTCEGSTTKTVASPLKRPVNRMLLTVTNTGSKPCHLYGYPAVRFEAAQSVPPAIEDSKPQAVVTLQPGASGYASIALSGADGASDGYTAKSLAVHFQGRSGNESVGEAAHPALPAKGAYIDNTIQVTYWQQEMEDAVMW